jgi:dipeptidase E
VIAYRSLSGLEITDDPVEVPAGYHADVVWDGLALLPFALAVHFKSDHSETESTNREIAFYEENGIPYRTLRDGEALVVRGGSQEIVGSPPDP